MNEPASSVGAVDSAIVEGASFSAGMKGLATAIVLSLAGLAWQAFMGGAWAQLEGNARWATGLLCSLVATGYWGILSSQTSIDARAIRQTWLWEKRVLLADITQVKLIHVPGLSWLIAPRLVVRSGGLGTTTFHAADARVLSAFRKLAYGE